MSQFALLMTTKILCEKNGLSEKIACNPNKMNGKFLNQISFFRTFFPISLSK